MTATDSLFSNPRRVEALADLLANVWQFGYVTTDLDRATEFMAGDLPAPARGHRVLLRAGRRKRLVRPRTR
jgi:hypothetical protein